MGFLSQNAPQPRDYQVNIANSVLTNGSTLVVLPTGMGKTYLALLVADKILDSGSVLFLAPTKPLIAQHQKTTKELLTLKEDQIVLVSGQLPAKKRQELYQLKPKFLLSTPQTIANDLKKNRLEWYFNLVVFDEAHRAVGKYAYTYIANIAKEKKAILLGLTASPGGQKKKIEEIVQALGIENVEIRTNQDKDVLPYIKPMEISWIRVPLSPELLKLKRLLETMIEKNYEGLKNLGFSIPFKSKKKLLELKEKIFALNKGYKYHALSLYFTVFSLVHLLELTESQGVEAAKKFVDKLKKRKQSASLKRIFKDQLFVEFEKLLYSAKEHPKINKLLEIIKSREEKEKFIVFCQYRDQVNFLVEHLRKNGLAAKPFMGKKEGFNQKQQAQIISEFREDKFNILVATSIGEEGLDIPSVDNVIFYEPVPSEIRAIQRRGRAGRAKLGRIFGLIAQNTRDEGFYWSALKKEQKMKRIVKELAEQSKNTKGRQKNIQEKEKEKKEETKHKPKQTNLLDFFG
ncbi:MAG: helicase-related protein [Candidatus Anstonellaceae archaeon]